MCRGRNARAAQETATKEPRKVEFEAVVNEEGGRAAFSWTEGEDVTEKATAYCKENTKEELWERCISAVKQQVAASLMEAELPALDLEVQVAEDKTATFSHAEGGDLRLEAHTFCSEYVAEDKVPVCAHHLVQGAVQKAQQLAAAGDDGAAAADASAGAGGASQDAAPAKTAPKQDAAPAKTAPTQTKSAPAKTPSDWARLVGPALVALRELTAQATRDVRVAALLDVSMMARAAREEVRRRGESIGGGGTHVVGA